MEFGTLIFTRPRRAISNAKRAEELGYSHAWSHDSHMIGGDAWARMALAAVNTGRIKLATGVVVAANRIAPATAAAIGAINELASGRVILGYCTGHTGRRVMDLPPVRHRRPARGGGRTHPGASKRRTAAGFPQPADGWFCGLS